MPPGAYYNSNLQRFIIGWIKALNARGSSHWSIIPYIHEEIFCIAVCAFQL
jgi:hypothetical protein